MMDIKTREKIVRYESKRKLERIPIREKQILGRFNVRPVKEDGYWIIRHKGTVIRNKSRNNTIIDLATIRGYDVGRQSKQNRTAD